ncbi:MAG: hypothetical protein ABID87_02715 [Chloroflexota bacterium]
MSMTWYPNEESKPRQETESSAFRQHDEAMQRFRRAHPAWTAAENGAAAAEEDPFTLMLFRHVSLRRFCWN